MTTPNPFENLLRLHEIQDPEALRLVSRVVESQLTMMEAQVNQLNQLRGALAERQQSMSKQRAT